MDWDVRRRSRHAGYIEEEASFATSAGTPQGGIISPVIANMALDGLETAVWASVGSSKLSRSKAQLNVARYADDFIVTGVSKDVLEFKVLPAVRQVARCESPLMRSSRSPRRNGDTWPIPEDRVQFLHQRLLRDARVVFDNFPDLVEERLNSLLCRLDQ
nr:reverse transcriptase domain-containing protein [Pseudomonas sp. BF-R-19]